MRDTAAAVANSGGGDAGEDGGAGGFAVARASGELLTAFAGSAALASEASPLATSSLARGGANSVA